jgi:hypothetical protein
MLRITVDGVPFDMERDQPPPNLDRVMGYQNSLIGLKGRRLLYAIPGLPGSWPEIYGVNSFNLEEHDTLYSGIDMGELFILGAKGGILRIQSLPRVSVSNFAFGAPEQIPGAPGVVGPYAMAKVALQGKPMAAYISHYGVYLTDGYSVQRISDEWDWSAYSGIDKSGWVLHWDWERFVLILGYATTGTTNNRYALFHMHPDHRKANGQPKAVWDQYGSYNDLASGQVGNTRRLYSAHSSNGIVYTEDYGSTDASESYDDDATWPFILKTRRMYGDETEWAALAVFLRHSDFGDGQTCSVAWTVGRDQGDGSSHTKTKTVSLEGTKTTQFDVAVSGDWHEATFTHTGSAGGSFDSLQIEARGLGERGTVKVA